MRPFCQAAAPLIISLGLSMPELPEVETVLRGLAPVIEGQRITKAAINRLDLRWPFPENMALRLERQSILQLRRRSKYILADLSSKETLLIHLGMSGRILVSGTPLGRYSHQNSAHEKHDHVVLDFSNGTRITFNDPRRFGTLDIYDTSKESSNKFLEHLGPEPLGNHFNAETFVKKIKRRKSPIKSVLLDQRIIAGLGNIYVCETLFRAGISPRKASDKISLVRLKTLVPHIKDVLTEAIAAGGSSLRDFKHTDGELGYFQHNFDVYGREGEPCSRLECPGHIKRLVQSGRSSFYCPRCQK